MGGHGIQKRANCVRIVRVEDPETSANKKGGVEISLP